MHRLYPICTLFSPVKNAPKAWSDTRTFTRWFHEVFLAHIRSTTNDKVLLIMDNCGPHSAKISDPFGQVKMLPLPPNCTAAHQPMDQGIIQAVKMKYRYKLLSKVFETVEHRDELRQMSSRMLAGTTGLNEGKQAHLLDVQCILYEVWNNMEVSTIA